MTRTVHLAGYDGLADWVWHASTRADAVSPVNP
jgi:hypothetical protein